MRQRGWSVSAIARRLGADRKTVRAYLNGDRVPGQRRPAGPGRFGPYSEYCRARFADDPHLWATALFEEVTGLGYDGGYSSFTRGLRARGLRPRCERCAAAGTPAEFAVIEHPAGKEALCGKPHRASYAARVIMRRGLPDAMLPLAAVTPLSA